MNIELNHQTALLIVDVQQDFCGAKGKLAQYGIDVSLTEAAIDQIVLLIDGAHCNHIPVIFVRLVTDPVTDSRAMKAWYAKQGLDPEDSVAICRRGTFGAEDYRIAPTSADYVVEKQKYSAFVGTNLELLLQGLDVKQLVVTGVTTECCVDSTVRDAFMKDYEVFLVKDACAAYEEDVHHMSVKILEMNFATVLTTEQVLAYWKGE